ncbi:MAG: polyisoprenoid-binding protein YceI [Maribacter sp.]|jgi:polyisoprenoid-binding protein YceI
MKKYLFLFFIPLLMVACKPTSTSSTNAVKTDPTLSSPPGIIYWTGSGGMANKDFKGTFDKWKFNKFNVPGGDYSKVEAEIAIDIASVNVDPQGLENHLRQDDFLDAAAHPTAIIKINGAQQPKGMDSWVANGTLSINGMTQENVSIDFNVLESKPAKITGSTTIFRQDYEVGSMKSEKVKNAVKIEFEFTVPK